MDQFVMPSVSNPSMATLDVSRVARKYLDVPYAAESERQVLDIYLPAEGEGPFPIIMFIHGGAFVGGAKRSGQMLYVADGIARGYAVVSMEQRLLPEGKFPLPVFDVKYAIRFLKEHAEAYKLDPDRIALAGDSAGAYHAVFAAATAQIPAFAGPDADFDFDYSVKAAIGLFGVYDLAMQSQFSIDAGPFPGAKEVFNFADLFAGGNTRSCKALGYLTDCKTYVTSKMPKILIETGDADMVVPYRASLELVDKVRKVCGEDHAKLVIYPGANHGAPEFISPENIEVIFDFLREAL